LLRTKVRVTLAVVIKPGVLNISRRKVSDDRVEEELLSYALRRSLSGIVHGSSRVNSLYRRLCILHTTSCAAYLPILYTKNIASLPIQSRNGAYVIRFPRPPNTTDVSLVEASRCVGNSEVKGKVSQNTTSFIGINETCFGLLGGHHQVCKVLRD